MWAFSGVSLHWLSGGGWACGEPSVQGGINDTVRGQWGPGSRLANDCSDSGVEQGRGMRQVKISQWNKNAWTLMAVGGKEKQTKKKSVCMYKRTCQSIKNHPLDRDIPGQISVLTGHRVYSKLYAVP